MSSRVSKFLSEEKKDDDDALFLAAVTTTSTISDCELNKEECYEEEGLEAMWVEKDFASSTSPVAPSSLQRSRSSFGVGPRGGFSSSRRRRATATKNNHLAVPTVRLLEPRGTVIPRERTPSHQNQQQNGSSPSSKGGASQSQDRSPHDVSTLGFDNTFDDHDLHPRAAEAPRAIPSSPLSMSSLNDFLDGESAAEELQPMPNLSSENAGKSAPIAEEENESPSPVAAKEPASLNNPVSPEGKSSPAQSSASSSSAKKKRGLFSFARRSSPGSKSQASSSSVKQNSPASASPNKDEAKAEVNDGNAVSSPAAEVGATVASPTASPHSKATTPSAKSTPSPNKGLNSLSPRRMFQKKQQEKEEKDVQRVVATIVEKEEEEVDPGPSPHEAVDSAAQEVDGMTMQLLQTALSADGSVTSPNGIKKFASMVRPTKQPTSSPVQSSPPQTHTTAFVAAPKDVPHDLLMQKSWESLLSSEAASQQDVPNLLTKGVPGFGMENDGDDEDEDIPGPEYGKNDSSQDKKKDYNQDKYTIGAPQADEAAQFSEEDDGDDDDSRSYSSGDDDDDDDDGGSRSFDFGSDGDEDSRFEIHDDRYMVAASASGSNGASFSETHDDGGTTTVVPVVPVAPDAVSGQKGQVKTSNVKQQAEKAEPKKEATASDAKPFSAALDAPPKEEKKEKRRLFGRSKKTNKDSEKKSHRKTKAKKVDRAETAETKLVQRQKKPQQKSAAGQKDAFATPVKSESRRNRGFGGLFQRSSSKKAPPSVAAAATTKDTEKTMDLGNSNTTMMTSREDSDGSQDSRGSPVGEEQADVVQELAPSTIPPVSPVRLQEMELTDEVLLGDEEEQLEAERNGSFGEEKEFDLIEQIRSRSQMAQPTKGRDPVDYEEEDLLLRGRLDP